MITHGSVVDSYRRYGDLRTDSIFWAQILIQTRNSGTRYVEGLQWGCKITDGNRQVSRQWELPKDDLRSKKVLSWEAVNGNLMCLLLNTWKAMLFKSFIELLSTSKHMPDIIDSVAFGWLKKFRSVK
jgi:hypothetical protein